MNFCPGLNPDLTVPNVSQAASAERAFRDAIEKNSHNQKNVDGVSEHEANILLSWISYHARQALSGIYQPQNLSKYSDEEAQSFFTPKKIYGLCGEGSSFVGFQCELLGMDHHYNQIVEVHPGVQHNHAFSTVKIPIKDHAGNVSVQPYLIDITFRQFFSTETIKPRGIEHAEWGPNLSQTSKGKEFADTLLRQGYAKFTPDLARMFLESRLDDHGKTISAPTDDSEMMQKFDHSAERYDFVHRNHVIYSALDFRCPVMVENQEPFEAVGILHREQNPRMYRTRASVAPSQEHNP